MNLMRLRFIFLFSSICLPVFFITGCGGVAGSENGDTQMPLPVSHHFPLQVGNKTIQVELALSPEESARGLMERTEMGEDEGMIFLYPKPIRASFWMKNTLLPLDIGFFNSEGVLLEIYRMYPRDETAVKSQSKEIHFALEMNQGWFSANKIRPGAVLDRQALRRGIEARGFSPEKFGLREEDS